ncbi:18345_t:CDS:1, partial [Acaulospora morrowiae]
YCDPMLEKWERAMHLIPVYGFECRCEKCEGEEPSDLDVIHSIPVWWL